MLRKKVLEAMVRTGYPNGPYSLPEELTGWRRALLGDALLNAANNAQARAAERFAGMDEPTRASLAKTVVAGLPGRMVEAHNLHQFQARANLLRSRRLPP